MKVVLNLLKFRNQFQLLRTYSNEIKKEFKVNRFGVLSVEHKGHLNVSIIDPIKYPDQTIAHLRLDTTSPSQNFNEANYDASSSTIKVNTCINDVNNTSINNSRQSSVVDLEIPVKYDVNIKSSGGRVSIRDLENDSVKATLSDASCKLVNLKSNRIDIIAENCDINSSKTLHTNGKILIKGKGSVNLDQMIGEHFCIELDQGDIQVKSLYVEKCTLSVVKGDVRLGQVHQSVNINIHQEGSVHIDSLDGDVTVRLERGGVDMFACQPRNIDVSTQQGDINLSLGEDHDLSRHSIDICTDSKHQHRLNNNEVYKGLMSKVSETGKKACNKFTLKTEDGNICLSIKNWADTFLKKKSHEKAAID